MRKGQLFNFVSDCCISFPCLFKEKYLFTFYVVYSLGACLFIRVCVVQARIYIKCNSGVCVNTCFLAVRQFKTNLYKN